MSSWPLPLALGVVAAFAMAIAALLRVIRAPAWSVLAGVLAGILIGPTIAGRLQPDWHERTFVGARESRLHVDELASRLEMNRLGAEALDGDGDDILRMGADVRTDLADAERQLQRDRWDHALAARWFTGLLVGAFFLLAGIARQPATGPRPDWFQPLSIGAWAAVVPGGIALLLLRAMDFDIVACLAAASALAVGGVLLPRGDLEAAERAEPGGRRLMVAACRVASIAAILALAWSLAIRHGAVGLWFLVPAAALPLGWLLTARGVPVAATILDHVIVPVLAALIAIRVELFEHFSVWPVVLVLILTGDGRWLGAYVGAMLARPRRGLATMGLALASMSAGRSQLAFAALALYAGALAEPLAFALLLGALFEELTRNIRATVAARVTEPQESTT